MRSLRGLLRGGRRGTCGGGGVVAVVAAGLVDAVGGGRSCWRCCWCWRGWLLLMRRRGLCRTDIGCTSMRRLGSVGSLGMGRSRCARRWWRGRSMGMLLGRVRRG